MQSSVDYEQLKDLTPAEQKNALLRIIKKDEKILCQVGEHQSKCQENT